MPSTRPSAPYFLMAHHRSGSNFLNDLLQSHPCLECINEPFSMHTKYFRDCDLDPWGADDFDVELFHRSLAAHPAVRDYLAEFRAYLSQSTHQRVIGFKDTVLFEKLPWLKAFMPGLKIIFLKRDPRSIVSSVLRTNLLQFWNYAELVPPAFRRLFPDYVSTTAQASEATRAAEMVAMSVATRYEYARRSLQEVDHLALHLDQLMREPESSLQAIAGYLGIEAHDRQLAFLAQRQVETRGGPFSSFRAQGDVQRMWERDLDAAQIRAIEDVMQCT